MNTEIKDLLMAESTYIDFKVSLESSKPKSWLKTIVAFANGLGGKLLFGIDDNRKVVGLKDIQKDSERISNFIKTKIDPLITFELKPIVVENKDILILTIPSCKMTPYFYVNDGSRTAYVRIGNESVTAPSYLLHELTLKGQRMTFDSLPTSEEYQDASFTLFSSTYRQSTGKRLEGRKDLLSFTMLDQTDHLTYSGILLEDNCSLLQSRVFCTRWAGLNKGTKTIDAIDDKEYSGNIISLLKDSTAFVKTHSKKAWKIEGMNRVEYEEYPGSAVREALVNALVHRDYNIIGSEIHIDIYDDRLEIISPGGMFDGKNIQEVDINRISSIRRNPILADILSRLDYMERRGSGLRRIKESFIDPSFIDFYSNESAFFVIMKNQYYNLETTHTNERIRADYERIMSGLDSAEKSIVEYVIQNQQITTKEAMKITNLSSSHVRRIFVALQEKNVLLAKGDGRGRHYIINN